MLVFYFSLNDHRTNPHCATHHHPHLPQAPLMAPGTGQVDPRMVKLQSGHSKHSSDLKGWEPRIFPRPPPRPYHQTLPHSSRAISLVEKIIVVLLLFVVVIPRFVIVLLFAVDVAMAVNVMKVGLKIDFHLIIAAIVFVIGVASLKIMGQPGG